MGSSPTFLLSNIEISRVAWRPGNNANELIVEVNADNGSCPSSPVELVNLDPLGKGGEEGYMRKRDRVIPGVTRTHTTRIGTIHRNDSAVDLAARLYAVRRPGTGGTITSLDT